jgi:hypothetical protein
MLSFYNAFILFSLVSCYYERLEPSTKVEDEALPLISFMVSCFVRTIPSLMSCVFVSIQLSDKIVFNCAEVGYSLCFI